MPRTPVKPFDLVTAIAALIDGQSVNGGTIKATVNGSSISIRTHSDSAPLAHSVQYELMCH